MGLLKSVGLAPLFTKAIVNFIIASSESCGESQPMSQAMSVKAIAIITMELMQTYEMDNGVVGVR